MRLVVLLVLSLVVSGCVSVPGGTVADVDAGSAAFDPFGGLGDPLIVDHDHADLAAHALSSPSMEMLARLTFADIGAPTLTLAEADLLGDSHLVVSGLLDGFYIVDVSDAQKPRAVSFAPMAGFLADVKASESGNFVFMGVQLAGTLGVQAWNVAVRERPVPAGFFPMQSGCHMLAVHGDILYCAPNDATVRLFEIVETPAAVALVPRGAYAPKGAPLAPVTADADNAGEEFTHDMTVQDDPLTGEPVMYVSFWEYGLRVVDVSDPDAPVELGAWLGAGAEETYEGNIHTSMATMVDGKRVLVTVPEYATVPSVTFIDATDYANMTALGVWAPKPADAWGEQARSFSTHNFQVLDGRVYMAMYHGGVWVIDGSTAERLAAPVAVGYYLPADGPALPSSTLGSGPSVWDVVLKDGVVFATDMGQGLYALHHADDAFDPALTSFA